MKCGLLPAKCRLRSCILLSSSDCASCCLQYKDRINLELIKPAVNFRETGSRSATKTAAGLSL